MTYHIKLQGAVGEDELERLRKGWRWENVPVRPTGVTALATTGKNTWVEMTVPEVRPRALKAAGDLLRHSVLKVSRVRLGTISFEGLAMGEARDLSKGEINDLRAAAGLGGARPAAQPGGKKKLSEIRVSRSVRGK
jgi:pseudouridine synthase